MRVEGVLLIRDMLQTLLKMRGVEYWGIGFWFGCGMKRKKKGRHDRVGRGGFVSFVVRA